MLITPTNSPVLRVWIKNARFSGLRIVVMYEAYCLRLLGALVQLPCSTRLRRAAAIKRSASIALGRTRSMETRTRPNAEAQLRLCSNDVHSVVCARQRHWATAAARGPPHVKSGTMSLYPTDHCAQSRYGSDYSKSQKSLKCLPATMLNAMLKYAQRKALESDVVEKFFKSRLPCVRISGKASVSVILVRGKLYESRLATCVDKTLEPFLRQFGTPIAVILAV